MVDEIVDVHAQFMHDGGAGSTGAETIDANNFVGIAVPALRNASFDRERWQVTLKGDCSVGVVLGLKEIHAGHRYDSGWFALVRKPASGFDTQLDFAT